ncbi:MAG: PAS domain-containing protein [Spirochaetes bacterium]|nr:PAS domain-containing protein [Spirochaetota bacterium]
MRGRFRHAWIALTAPRSADFDESRSEFLTRVVSIISGVTAGGAALFFLAGWLYGAVPLDSLVIAISLTVIFFFSWWLSSRGNWRFAGFIPPFIVYLTAIYGSYIGGAGAPAMILYVLTVILAAVLIGQRAQWIFLILGIAAYAGVGSAQYLGIMTQKRFTATALPNRIIIVTAVYLAISALIWLMVRQYRNALAEARSSALELETIAEELAETNLNLETEIAERRRTEVALIESEEQYRMLTEASPEMIYYADGEGLVRYLNKAAAGMFNAAPEDLVGKNISELFPPHLASRHIEAIREVIRSGRTFYSEILESFPGGDIWIEARLSPIMNSAGTVIGALGLSQDITARKKAEEGLKVSLLEKEVLLREIHHRVKNNFQIIVSLLSLQARNIDNDDTTRIFNDSINRIRAMALVHESLYRSTDIAEIDFASYIRTISKEIFDNYASIDRRPELRLDIDEIHLAVDQAIPCGLIVNELITNSLKYAFPGKTEPGRITVSLKCCEKDTATLRVADDGAGLPEDFNSARSRTLGIELVMLLAKQIQGTWALDRAGGTAWSITFPRHKSQAHSPGK